MEKMSKMVNYGANMKKIWGLRPYMEISDFISSVKPKQLLSSEFNDILSKCEDVREYLHLGSLALSLKMAKIGKR